MFHLRMAKFEDLEDLYALSRIVTFINLPSDKKQLAESLENSEKSFHSPSQNLAENVYIFVLEDIQKKKVIGTSMIHGQHGTPEEPHFFLKVGEENKFSHTTQTGFIHGTLKFGHTTNGYTEIGGLVIDPNYRGLPYKLGKQISFVRFLYLAMFPHCFRSYIHSELMPPFDGEGKSPLWEAIGRRFLNMDYHNADLLSRKNKEFLLNLYPKETIYETLLPLEARHAIGKVGKNTEPVKNMLEEIGFSYTDEVDPFDGGPHYRAKLEDIAPVKSLFYARVQPSGKKVSDSSAQVSRLLLTIPDPKNEFRAMMINARIEKTREGRWQICPDPEEQKHIAHLGEFETQAIIV